MSPNKEIKLRLLKRLLLKLKAIKRGGQKSRTFFLALVATYTILWVQFGLSINHVEMEG